MLEIYCEVFGFCKIYNLNLGITNNVWSESKVAYVGATGSILNPSLHGTNTRTVLDQGTPSPFTTSGDRYK